MKRFFALGLVLVCVAPALADIIHDDFESYADTAALNVPWPKGVGTDVDTYLETGANGPTWPGVQCVHNTTVAARRDWTFTRFQNSTGDFTWQFDYYDFVGNTADPRQYGQILANDAPVGGALAQLIAMGQYNAALPTHNPNKYQARVAVGGAGWFNLNTNRSVGWHTFEAVVHPTTVDFYVDGLLDTAGVACPGGWWYQARIGSGLSSAAGQARYDNFLLTPEPATLALLGLGLLAARRR